MEWIKYLLIAVILLVVVLFAVKEIKYYFGKGISGQGAITPNSV